MSTAPRIEKGPVVRVYRKGRDIWDDIVFTVLLICILLGASVRLLRHIKK